MENTSFELDPDLDPSTELEEVALDSGTQTEPEIAQPSRSLLAASSVPAIGTALSRVTGLMRVAALTAALGLTSIADVYNLANTSPNIIYELVIGGVLSSTLVPLFIQAHHDRERGIDDDAESVMVTVGLTAITVLTVVAILASPVINHFFAMPLHGAEKTHQIRLGTTFLMLLFPQVYFYGLTTLATALLHSRRRFAAPAFAPVLTNVVISITAIAVYKLNLGSTNEMRTVYLLGLGTTAGIAAMAVALLPAIRRAEISLKWDFRPRHPAVKSVIRLSGWTVGFAVSNQVALLIILTFARGAGVGAVSAYQYAFIFFQLPYGLIAVSLMTAVLPELASAANSKDESAFAEKFREGLSLMLTLMIPAAVAYLFFGRSLIAVLLQRGQFDAEATQAT
ncbi:MAG: murein biosynthesis integral membrane protein MurJ, partial [Microthrixaceae bacterium]|nr:murein biosynthesis integral membrane protein MurJ [Microthrixaceae bacterium]